MRLLVLNGFVAASNLSVQYGAPFTHFIMKMEETISAVAVQKNLLPLAV
jgi:hypothetical protein